MQYIESVRDDSLFIQLVSSLNWQLVLNVMSPTYNPIFMQASFWKWLYVAHLTLTPASIILAGIPQDQNNMEDHSPFIKSYILTIV